MCGIAGIIANIEAEDLLRIISRMTQAQLHRGPDGQGSWSGTVNGKKLALSHTRLAVFDLSEAGRQPMVSECGQHVLTYNGEIFNYVEIKKELIRLGVIFKTSSDTEVLLRALMFWGTDAIPKLNGMWAFAWLDLGKSTLLLSRDYFGIKPLYYYQGEEGFFFASEIKAILAGVGKKFPINNLAASRYLLQSLSNAQEETFFSSIFRHPAGHNLVFDLRKPSVGKPLTTPYWNISAPDPAYVPDANLIGHVRELFFDSVRIRMRSDVPVGVLLSGGIDSSATAAAMQAFLGKDSGMHMLSIVNEDRRYDEQPFIDIVASHLRLPVVKVPLRLDPGEAFRLLDEVTYQNDEPVPSFSIVAHYLLMKEARQLGMTVALSGQGADELLCGYRKYLGFYLISLVRSGQWSRSLSTIAQFLKQRTVLNQFNFLDAKRYLPAFLLPKEVNICGPRIEGNGNLLALGLGDQSLSMRQSEDLYRFSVPALVHCEDRMSMSFGREIRLPFLDHRLVDTLIPLEPEWKLREGWTKWIFRKAMEPFLPKEIIWRRDKQGFSNPENEWLKHDFKGAVDEFINDDMLLGKHGFIKPKALKDKFQRYCNQRSDLASVSFQDIFNPISLEIWSRQLHQFIDFDA